MRNLINVFIFSIPNGVLWIASPLAYMTDWDMFGTKQSHNPIVNCLVEGLMDLSRVLSFEIFQAKILLTFLSVILSAISQACLEQVSHKIQKNNDTWSNDIILLLAAASFHYNDVTQASWRLQSLTNRQFVDTLVQVNLKEYIKAP